MNDIVCRIVIDPKEIEDGKGHVLVDFDGRQRIAPVQAGGPFTTEMINRLDHIVHRAPEACGHDDLMFLGRLLFHILLGAGVATRLGKDDDGKSTRTPLERPLSHYFLLDLDEFETKPAIDRKLRIDLSIPDTSPLAAYPWEFLYIDRPQGGFFLGGQKPNLILTRSRELIPNIADPPARLVVWVAWARPAILDQLAGIEELAAEIESALGGKDNAHVVPIENVSWNGLRDRIANTKTNAAERPDIIHFIGHGRVLGESKELAFQMAGQELETARAVERGNGRNPEGAYDAKWVAAKTLASAVSEAPPRMFFMHSCNTGRAAMGVKNSPTVEMFRGAAQEIADAGVPFVIAMQYAIENEDAKTFAKEFYKTLGAGQSVGDAVSAGRYKLGGEDDPPYGHRRFATPVVFMRASSQALLRPNAAAPAAAQGVKCPYQFCSETIIDGQTACSCQRKLPYRLCVNGHSCAARMIACDVCGKELRPVADAPTVRPASAQPRDLGSA